MSTPHACYLKSHMHVGFKVCTYTYSSCTQGTNCYLGYMCNAYLHVCICSFPDREQQSGSLPDPQTDRQTDRQRSQSCHCTNKGRKASWLSSTQQELCHVRRRERERWTQPGVSQAMHSSPVTSYCYIKHVTIGQRLVTTSWLRCRSSLLPLIMEFPTFQKLMHPQWTRHCWQTNATGIELKSTRVGGVHSTHCYTRQTDRQTKELS